MSKTFMLLLRNPAQTFRWLAPHIDLDLQHVTAIYGENTEIQGVKVALNNQYIFYSPAM